jgi:osmoprotectant transport system permease protein
VIFRLIEHLQLAFYSLILALAVGILIGIFISKYTRLAIPIISVAGILDTIPSLAILSVLIPLVGIGKPPAIITLFLYSLMPIIRNTYVGIREINPAIIEAAEGMGMTEMQILIKVRLPLALPVIMAGIRTTATFNIGITTLAAVVGAGGLGTFIWTGLMLMDYDLMLIGALTTSILAIVTDAGLGLIERRIKKRVTGRGG